MKQKDTSLKNAFIGTFAVVALAVGFVAKDMYNTSQALKVFEASEITTEHYTNLGSELANTKECPGSINATIRTLKDGKITGSEMQTIWAEIRICENRDLEMAVIQEKAEAIQKLQNIIVTNTDAKTNI